MAGFKHRYLILKVESQASPAILSNVRNILYRSIKTNFGDYALSLIDTFEVVETYEHLGIAIVRCNLAIYKYLCYSIVATGRIKENDVRMTIESVSGILRKLKRKYLTN